MKVKIKDIVPNHHRLLYAYPIDQKKVDAIRKSIKQTGFWDNIVGRKIEDGKVELAYGHHRWYALQQQFKPNHEVNIIIRDLNDATLLKIMAAENQEEWKSNAAIEHETIKAAVAAYARGEIVLPEVKDKTRSDLKRQAPSVLPVKLQAVDVQGGFLEDRSYTMQQIADFFEWTEANGNVQDRVRYGFQALELIEEGLLTEADFDGLSRHQAKALIIQMNRVMKKEIINLFEYKQAAKVENKLSEELEKIKLFEQAAQTSLDKARNEEERATALAEKKKVEEERREVSKQFDNAMKRRIEIYDEARRNSKEIKNQAAKVGREISKGFKDGSLTHKEAEQVAIGIEIEDWRKEKGHEEKFLHPETSRIDFIESLGQKIAGLLAQDDLHDKLNQVLKERETYHELQLNQLADTLEAVSVRFQHYAKKLKQKSHLQIIK